MRALCESLGGNIDFWLYTLAPGSIVGYDMFTKLLREEWGNKIDESIQLDNDGVQDNHNEIINDFPYQIDSSSPDPTVDMPLNDSLMQKNNDEQISTLQDYNFDINI